MQTLQEFYGIEPIHASFFPIEASLAGPTRVRNNHYVLSEEFFGESMAAA